MNALENMNELLKNPFFVFLVALVVLWLAFKLLKVFIGFFGLFVLAFVVLFLFNARFRRLTQTFLKKIFRN